MLELIDLKKNYGSKEAVKGLNLTVNPGELFVFLGPNGAGKTTTLKMITGLLRPTSGTVRVGGIDRLKNPAETKKKLSFVPDVPYVYDKLSPLELLRFVGKLYNMKPENITARSEEMLKFFSLWDVRDVLIEEFSHGMKQKAILSAALLHGPEILILDEPMVGLDPVSIKSFKDFLKEQSRKGLTVIFSTHTLSTAEEMADRIAVINHGELAALGTMEELRAQYQSTENLESMFLKMIASK